MPLTGLHHRVPPPHRLARPIKGPPRSFSTTTATPATARLLPSSAAPPPRAPLLAATGPRGQPTTLRPSPSQGREQGPSGFLSLSLLSRSGATTTAAACCRPPPWISALRASFPKIEGGNRPLEPLSLSLFPLLPAAPETQDGGGGHRRQPRAAPLFPSEGKGRRKAFLPLGPCFSRYFLKNPLTSQVLLQKKPSLLLYFKTDPSTI